MKKTKIFIIKMLMVAFVSVVSAQQTIDQKFSEFANVQTVESSFEMKEYVSIADKPFISAGRFYFQKPDSLKWEYLSPFNRGFLINGGKIFSWEEKDGKKEIKDISSNPAAKAVVLQLYAFISMDKTKISKSYKIEDFEDGITLFPLGDSKKQMISKINIFFRKDIAAVEQVEIISKTGDKSLISFFNTKINESLPQNVFDIDVK
ncbi:MAG: outer membrane lipoprotein carrier protein LolA [Endomicrobia bacterium]|nr:outer membrane lipoprotein carrier protein LolA [Endomicrobiia bacterium]MCL2799275.1 outer membrane lipoprotein carrier protein LolA [Endomicrobiia bacterium]